MSGSMPNSVWLPSVSVIGQAEKRTDHPRGSSLLKGIPLPPPVRSPMTVTLADARRNMTKALAALKVRRFASTTTGFCHRIPAAGSMRMGCGAEKSAWPGPVLCCIQPTVSGSLKFRQLLKDSIQKSLVILNLSNQIEE